MAYITVVLALALVCWLVLAARGGDSTRTDAAAASAAPQVRDVPRPSSHGDRGARGIDELADLRRARQFPRYKQAA